MVLVLAVPLLLAVLCYTLALRVVVAGSFNEVLRALGDALFVAFVVAVIGDLYLRVRLAEDSVRRGVRGAITEMFGLSEAAPDELQSAVQEFARAEIYTKEAKWRIHFEWKDRERGILEIILTMEKSQCALRNNYLPSDELWTLDSTLDYESEYLNYSLHCPPARINVNETAPRLGDYCRRKKGRLVLDQARLLADRLDQSQRIQYKQEFNINRSAKMYRHSSGYVPLMRSSFEVLFKLEIDGPALRDLKVAVFHPKGAGDQYWNFDGRKASQPARNEWRNVTPGQATIVSWSVVGQPGKNKQRGLPADKGHVETAEIRDVAPPMTNHRTTEVTEE